MLELPRQATCMGLPDLTAVDQQIPTNAKLLLQVCSSGRGVRRQERRGNAYSTVGIVIFLKYCSCKSTEI